MAYRIFTDAASDLTPDMLKEYPSVEIISMQIEINEQEYTYGPHADLTIPAFYNLLRQGHSATTTQINPYVYFFSFDTTLEQGLDVLYLGFSSALSGCVHSAQIAAERLTSHYPDRRIICLDTHCASLGEGFLVLEAAKRQAEGMGIDELALWVQEQQKNVCQWFTVDSFEHLRNSGRVTASSAAIGSILSFKPMLHVDDAGRLEVMAKPRGQRKAMELLVQQIKTGWTPELGRRIIIAHGDAPELASQLSNAVSRDCPDAEIQLAEIGPVIGTHTGPGIQAVIYWGNNR